MASHDTVRSISLLALSLSFLYLLIVCKTARGWPDVTTTMVGMEVKTIASGVRWFETLKMIM